MAQLASIRQMSGQVSRSSAGEYQAKGKENVSMKYETPVVEIVMFENEDIVTDSAIETPTMPA